MILTYRYRVKDGSAARHLRRMAKAVNFVWNYCGGIHNDSRRLNRCWPSAFALMKLTAGSSRELNLHSDTIETVCRQFAISRDSARRRPRWRANGGGKRALGWVPFRHVGTVQVKGDTVRMLGHDFRVWLSRPIPKDIRGGSFSEDAAGRWFINLRCEVAEDLPLGNGEVGIDLGLMGFAALSTGETIANPRHLRKSAFSLARAQRAGRKALARRIHRKVAAQRRHFLHETSTRIARENALVCVGDVNSSQLARTKMAKSVLDAGWSEFRSMLRYKIAMRPGAVFVDTDERYSTQTCSDCGFRNGALGGAKGLRVRSWECGNCGSVHDRDTNAAINILRSGRSVALQMTGTVAA